MLQKANKSIPPFMNEILQKYKLRLKARLRLSLES